MRPRDVLLIAAMLIGAVPPAMLPARAAATPPLVITIGYQPMSLDPQVDNDASALTVLGNVYQRLVRATGTTNARISLDLATGWQQSSGGRMWAFHLRHGVRFHSGDPVDATAVKFTFDRLLQLKQGMAANFTEIASVSAPSPDTVVFHLKVPFFGFVETLASLWGTGIVDPKVVLAHQVGQDLGVRWLSNHDAGSGPWMLREWIYNQEIVLDPFRGYSDSTSRSRPAEDRSPINGYARLSLTALTMIRPCRVSTMATQPGCLA